MKSSSDFTEDFAGRLSRENTRRSSVTSIRGRDTSMIKVSFRGFIYAWEAAHLVRCIVHDKWTKS